MKKKIFTLLMLVVTLLVGCGTATNNDVPANGVTEAPRVTESTATPIPTSTPTPEPTATPVPTSTPTPEPTATPIPTSTPTPEPTATPIPTSTPTPEPTATPIPTSTPTPEPTEAPVASTADWKDFEVTLGRYTIKLRETTLGELLDTGLIDINNKEEVLARESECGFGNEIEPYDAPIGNFDVANYEANTVKSPADCVILNMSQDSWGDLEKLKLEICGFGVGDTVTQESLEAALGKCSRVYTEEGAWGIMYTWYTWYANGTDSDGGYIEITTYEDGERFDLVVKAPYDDVKIYSRFGYYR